MFARTIIGLLILVPLLAAHAQPLSTDPVQIQPPTIEQRIEVIFGSKAKIAVAVLKHESGLNVNAKGYNCHYYTKDGIRYSAACATKDRSKAWSVDCGIGQINVKGTECPKKLLTIDGNLEQVAIKYKTQGLGAWNSYTSGAYKKYL